MAQASIGTGEVSANITGVARAAQETGAGAGQVFTASSELARQAERLSAEVAEVPAYGAGCLNRGPIALLLFEDYQRRPPLDEAGGTRRDAARRLGRTLSPPSRGGHGSPANALPTRVPARSLKESGRGRIARGIAALK